jgi:glycosyltransferase involved in cell wall biosynthesis
MPRVDLHVHSRFSDRPTNFFLKKMKAPESLTEPEVAYRLAKRRGMDFFTLTDPDTLEGCLQLSKYPDVFPSCETTVAFPEDDCKIKLLLFGLNEAQLGHVLNYRGNIFQVRDYLGAENIFHAVASPLEALSGRLGPDHVERLLLLFDHFETRSGMLHPRTNEYITALLDRLTPEFLFSLERKWKIPPASEKPWQKGYLGGSNDYCGQYIGLTWTDTASARSPAEMLETLRRRSGTPGGIHGSSLVAAHSMYRVAFQYYQKNLRGKNVREPDLISLLVSRVLQPGEPERLTWRQAASMASSVLRRMLRPRRGTSFIERRLLREFILAYNRIPPDERLGDIPRDDLVTYDERLYSLIDRVISEVTYKLLQAAHREFERGRIGNALSLGAAIIPLQSVLGPYLYSFNKLNADRPLLAALDAQFAPTLEAPSFEARAKKIAWFSDTVADVNGVSLTLHKMAAVAETLNADLTIICSVTKDKAPSAPRFLNFEPVGELPIPDYELQKLAVPPGLQFLRYLEEAGFTEYVISTPGPVGLIALLAAKMFHVPVRSIYHSDFPEHIRHITGDEGLYQSAWSFMRWFYGKADAVYSPSGFYRDQLIEHGFDPTRLFIFTRGTDLDFFNPKHRDESFYQAWGIRNRVVFVYTGRVSREKNLDTVLEAFLGDQELKDRAALVIIGDGPYASELKERYRHPSIAFPGFMKGKDLARSYASADVFVFPSTTDTYGNSVLEAQASGLPSLVSDEGGPKEIILPDQSGYVLAGHDVEAWRRAMRELTFDAELRARMGSAARARAAMRDWTTAFREFWNEDPVQVTPAIHPKSLIEK